MQRRQSLQHLPGAGAAVAGLVHAPLRAAATCRSQSPAGTVALVELFTSEGCSACPPADHWLSGVSAGELSPIAPLSLHVRYWDDGGWDDPGALDRRLAELQRRTAGARITIAVDGPADASLLRMTAP
jgi:hypothetical protein